MPLTEETLKAASIDIVRFASRIPAVALTTGVHVVGGRHAFLCTQSLGTQPISRW